MTQEEKDLLLRYLCARLPYGVICEYTSIQPGYELYNEIGVLESIQKDYQSYKFVIDGHLCGFSDFKPYLRPMPSMTEEERKDMGKIVTTVYGGKVVDDDFVNVIKYIDWLNEHHFDYRGLIEKGLAIEAPEGMYKIN